MANKPSFFSRLTGSNGNEEYDDFLDDPRSNHISFSTKGPERRVAVQREEAAQVSEESEGELAVDVYQTPDHIVIKALVAGVQPATIDISLTREMLTISGVRSDEREVEEDNYFQRELYWGSFSRTILLPEEVDLDMAEATEKHGILMIRLPKINKRKETKLKVRAR
jgi:HSP20 family protein